MSKLVAIIFIGLMVSAFAKVLDDDTDGNTPAKLPTLTPPNSTTTATTPSTTTTSTSGVNSKGLATMSTIFLNVCPHQSYLLTSK